MNPSIDVLRQNDRLYLKTLKVLYVEDEDGIREQLEQFLRRRCGEVFTATNGRKGLDAMERRQPDIVVTDILMPVMDGLKMCEVIRATSPQTPIIITTAFEEPHYFHRAIELGVQQYVAKPIDPEILEQALLNSARALRANSALREVEERYRLLFKLSHIAISISDADHRDNEEPEDGAVGVIHLEAHLLDCNEAFLRLVGFDNLETLRRYSFLDLLTPEHVALFKSVVREELLVRGFTREFEVELVRRDHSPIPVVVQLILRRDESGQPQEVWAVMRDITEQRRAEEQFRLSSTVFEFSQDAIMITDTDNHVVSVNQAFCRITGYSREEALGQNPRFLSSGRHDRDYYTGLWSALEQTGHWQGEIWNRRKSGEIYPEWLSISVVKDRHGKVTHHIAIFSDISVFKEATRHIEFLAHYDPLTGLPNRSLFKDRLEQALKSAERLRCRAAVLFFDLDRFKNINDSLGHSVGDALLVQVAKRIAGCLRDTDTVARLSGDEFAIVMTGLEAATDAGQVARKTLAVMERAFQVEGHELSVTTSIGISLFPEDGRDGDTLLKNADAAMYSAKQNGRNNFDFFTPSMSAEAFERLSLEGSLRRALERNQLELHYQVQVDANSGRITGMEALLRWRHDEMGMVSPGRFIPIAEETGLVIPIGEWVLIEACRQNLAWQRQGLPAVPVAVNLSVVQIRQLGFNETVRQALQCTGLDARYLELELTESIIMDSTEASIRRLNELKKTGIQLSIDDFGTGYSSLAYLKRLPIDKLKIDQSFTREIPHDPNNTAIASAIISLGHELGLKVIAEGVEIEGQLRYLKAQQCDEIQGYLFSPPLNAGEMEKLLARRVLQIP